LQGIRLSRPPDGFCSGQNGNAGRNRVFIGDGLAFNSKTVRGIERVNENIHVLAAERVLFEPVRKSLPVAGGKEPVQAMDNIPLEIAHLPIFCRSG
jgi:hypothetical protein